MFGFKALFKKELQAYFNVPIAYVFAVVFLLVVNGLFMTTFFLSGLCDMRSFFQGLPLYLVVFIPSLTMRLWAEERKSGTLSLLYTLPVSEYTLVLAKFTAAYLFTLLVLASTLVIPLMLSVLGSPDPGPIFTGYLGATLLTAFLLALGLAVSAFFTDQILAFIVALLGGLISLLVGTNLVSTSIDSWLPGLGSFLRGSLGLGVHYTNFAKGVLSLTDVVFFLSFTLIFLVINALTVGNFLRYKGRGPFGLGVLLLLGIGLLGNALLYDWGLPRFDFTAAKVFTVSPAAQKVLEKLEVPVKVTYYVSPSAQLPTPMKHMARDVRDILSEFAALSPNFSYRIVDPTGDPELIEALKKEGILPFSVQTIEKDQVSVRRIYSALAISYMDKKTEVIPQVIPDNLSTLEYDIVLRIFKLTQKSPPLVALFTPDHGPLGAQDPFALAKELLKQDGFKVKGVPLDRHHPLPPETRLLLVLDPGALSRDQLDQIDQFLHQGHPVIIAAQGFSYFYGPGAQGGITATALKKDLSINRLLKSYGVEIDPRMLLDKQSAILAVSSARPMGMFMEVVRTPVRFPMQVKVLPYQMNRDLSVTSHLSALLYLWGSALKTHPGLWKKAGLKAQVLFHSSKDSWLRPYTPGPFLPEDLLPPKGTGRGPYPLAVLLSGKFPRAFKLKGTRDNRPSHLVVIGCSSMFDNHTLQAYANADLLLNLVESLTLGDELLYIRAKTQIEHYLPNISTRQRAFWRVLVTGLPPVLWILVGVLWAGYRRRRRQRWGQGGLR